jgi:hypothetical protein
MSQALGAQLIALHTSQLSEAGYSVVPSLIESEVLADIAHRVDSVLAWRAGTRRLLDAPWCYTLAERLMANELLRDAHPAELEPVQCTLFIKATDRNWLVSPHQDLSIPVAERVNSSEFTGWSEKEGEVFVQPPITVLQQILAVRLHLDDCDKRNGALRVVPGSHRLGRLTAREVIKARDERGEVSVSVARGGVMLMRPLLIHASSKAVDGRPRRVLHFVFGPKNLPEEIRWPRPFRSPSNDG